MNKIAWINGSTKLNKATMEAFEGNIENAIGENTKSIQDINRVLTYDLNSYKTENVGTLTRNICEVKNGIAYISLYMTTGVAFSAGTAYKIFNLPAKLQVGTLVDFVVTSFGVSGRGYVGNDGIYVRFEQNISAEKALVFNVSYTCD